MRTNPFLRAQPPRAPSTEARKDRWSRRAAGLLVAATGWLMAACTGTGPQAVQSLEFSQRYDGFTYAEVKVVRQSEARSCGLAVLACVLNYWDRPATEAELLARYPVRSGLGHSLQTLQTIAQDQGLMAFAVSFRSGSSGTPAAQLSGHLAKGRPVIVAVRIPQGRYFGDPIPVLGTLDARTVRPFGLVPAAGGQEYKLHYVVVFGEDATRYLLMDPAYGIVTVPAASLRQWWSDMGYAALVCSPAPVPSPLSPTVP